MKNIYTGSYIGLGIVFPTKKRLEILNCISFMINKFKSNYYVFTNYSDQKDEGGEFIQERISQSDIQMLYDSDFFTIKFETQYNGLETQILISNSTIDDFVAIQIDFHEDSLMKCFNGDSAECLTFIENLCMELYQNICFEYAYCDNNANFAFTPLKMKKNGYKNYSLVLLPHNQDLTIIRQNWELDGFTPRQSNLIGTFLLKQMH